MKKIILFAFTLFFLMENKNVLVAQAPNYSWALKAGSSAIDNGVSSCTDNVGNIYVAGNFAGDTIMFGTDTLYKMAGDYNDVYLVKYDASGNVLWIQSGGGPGFNTITAVTCDVAGNVYIAGTYMNDVINFGTFTLTSFAGVNYNSDIFLVKYNSSGTAQWARRYAGVASDFANSLSADALGNIYLAGAFEGPSIAFGSTTFTTVTTSYPPQPFFAKIDSTGAVLWANRGYSLGSSQCSSVATDYAGNTFVTGYCNNGDLTLGTTTLADFGGGRDFVFVAKYSPTGTFLWAESFGSSVDNSFGVSITTDQLGNCFVAGKFMSPSIIFGTFTLINSNTSVFDFNGFLIKLNTAGAVKWAKKVGALGDQEFTNIISDSIGNVYTIGTFNATSIPIGTYILALTATSVAGTQNIFIAKYDSTGTVQWAKKAGGTNNDYSKSISIYGNSMYITGYYNSAMMYYDALSTPNYVSSGAPSDMFICKLMPSTVSVEQFISFSEEINIFPNPATTSITIESAKYQILSIKILNVLGEVVYSSSSPLGRLGGAVDISGVANGIYFVEIKTEREVVMKKIIKE